MFRVQLPNASLMLIIASFLLGLIVIYQHFYTVQLSSRLAHCPITSYASYQDVPVDTTGVQRRLPQALIIGFNKCGTSALRSFLTIHPDIVSPSWEICFFTDQYYRGLDWYRRQMPLSKPGQITIEKTPGYIQSYKSLKRIHEFNPKIKLLVIVRNPVTRLQSQYAHHMDKLPEQRRVTFESWLNQVVPFKERVKHSASYIKYIKEALGFFPMDQFLFLSEEELETDPISVLKEAQLFLGLRSLITDDMFVFDTKKNFYCVNMSHPLFPSLVEQVNKTNGCLKKSKGRDHPYISDDLVEKIVMISKHFVIHLFHLINKTFDWTYYTH